MSVKEEWAETLLVYGTNKFVSCSEWGCSDIVCKVIDFTVYELQLPTACLKTKLSVDNFQYCLTEKNMLTMKLNTYR